MAPRANWKGFLRLSLVTCPVALYPATSESEKISFNQLNRKTGHRIKYMKVDSDTGEEVRQRGHRQGLHARQGHLHRGDEGGARGGRAGIDAHHRDRRVRGARSEIDPRYLIRPYYLRPDGKVGHDAFAVIRETIREMNKVAIGRVVLTNREHIIALEPLDKGLMGTLLRYPYEVRSEEEYFDEIQDVKVTKDMLDLARHIVNQKSGRFEPDKFEDQYETALVDLINQKRAGKPITPKERPAGEQRRRSDGGAAAERRRRGGRRRRRRSGQEAAQGGGRPEGNADADRRQEAGEGNGREEAGGQAAAEVGVVRGPRPDHDQVPTRNPHETACRLPHGLQRGRSDAPQSLAPQGIGCGPVRAGARRTRRRRLVGRPRHRAGVRQRQAVPCLDERDVSAHALVRATRRESLWRRARRPRQDRLGPLGDRW